MCGSGRIISAVFLVGACYAARADFIAVNPAPTAPTAASESVNKPAYAVPTQTLKGRIIATVTINGRGPFRFMVDTGSNRTVIGQSTLAKLGMIPTDSQTMSVAGISGTELAPSVHIAALDTGDLHFREVDLPVLGGPVFNDVDGIIGMDGFNDMNVFADFDKDLITITQSKNRRLGFDYSVVSVRFLSERLLMADSRVGRIPVKVIIDTGGAHTLGNPALLKALTGGRNEDARAHHAGVIDVTAESTTAMIGQIPELQLGEVHVNGMNIVFADFQIFKTWGLEDQPALLIGMDVLGTLKALDIDYRRKEVAFLSHAVPQRGATTKFFSLDSW